MLEAVKFSLFTRLRKVKYRLEILIYWLRNCNQFAGVYIDPTVQITRRSKVKFGSGTVICEHANINTNSLSAGIEMVVGSNCWIGRRNFFSMGELLTIDDYVMTGNDCKFICAGHSFDDPLHAYLSSGTYSMGIQTIGLNVWIGPGVTVLGGVTIGRGSIVGANSFVRSSIPPFSVCVGSPATVKKRYSFREKRWKEVADWTAEDETSIISDEEYRHILHQNFKGKRLPMRASGKAMSDVI